MFGSLFKVLKYGLAALFLSVLLYLIVALLLSSISINQTQQDFPEALEIPVLYLVSNGVHVDLVVPLDDPNTDWESIFETNKISEDPNYTHARIGWGEENFYINTPNWSDLTLFTSFKALFLPSRGAIHIDLGRKPEEHYRTLILSRDQYHKLIKYILSGVEIEEGKAKRIGDFSYSNDDAFFYGTQNYHLFMTCNAWMNRGLKRAGIKSVVWTPFVSPLLRE